MSRPRLNYYNGFIPRGKMRVCLRVQATERIDTLAEAAKVALTYVELLRERFTDAGEEFTVADPPSVVVICGAVWATVVLSFNNNAKTTALINSARDLVDISL